MNLWIFLSFIERLFIRHPELLLALVCGGAFLLYSLIFNLTRVKLKNEDQKEEYLKNKFKHEIHNLKEDEFSSEIVVFPPYTKKKPWVVKKTCDRGFQGQGSFKSQYKDYLLYEILDEDLDKLITTHNKLS